MKRQIRVSKGALSDTIYAGHLNKAGNMWLDGKQDVTEDFYNTMGQVVPVNSGISIANEKEERFIYSCFPQTEEGIKKAMNFFAAKLKKIQKGEKL
jgi:hypothetical protein